MKKNWKLFVVLGLLFLVMTGVLVYRNIADYLNPNADDFVANTSGNLNNGGYVCQLNDKVYFSNFYDSGRIYEMNADETKMRKVCDNGGSNILADGKNIYYYMSSISSLSSMGGFVTANLGIYRTGISNHKTRLLDKVTCGVVQLVGNNLYYQRYDNEDGVGLQIFDIRSKKTSRINPDAISPSNVYNNQIYYAGEMAKPGIFTWNLETESGIQISEAKAYMPQLVGSYIYYMNVEDDYKLYRFNTSDSTAEKVTEDRVDAYIVVNDLIFYQKNSTTEPALMVMGTDGNGLTALADGNYCGFGATTNALYFREFNTDIPMYKIDLNRSLEVTKFDAAQQAALKNLK